MATLSCSIGIKAGNEHQSIYIRSLSQLENLRKCHSIYICFIRRLSGVGTYLTITVQHNIWLGKVSYSNKHGIVTLGATEKIMLVCSEYDIKQKFLKWSLDTQGCRTFMHCAIWISFLKGGTAILKGDENWHNWYKIRWKLT